MGRRRDSYRGGSTILIPGRDGKSDDGPPMAIARAQAQAEIEAVATREKEKAKAEALAVVDALERDFAEMARRVFRAVYLKGPAPDLESPKLRERIDADRDRLGRDGGPEARRRLRELDQHLRTLGEWSNPPWPGHLFGIPVVASSWRRWMFSPDR